MATSTSLFQEGTLHQGTGHSTTSPSTLQASPPFSSFASPSPHTNHTNYAQLAYQSPSQSLLLSDTLDCRTDTDCSSEGCSPTTSYLHSFPASAMHSIAQGHSLSHSRTQRKQQACKEASTPVYSAPQCTHSE